MKEYLIKVFKDSESKLNYLENKSVAFSIPANKDHGDFSTNIAMILTKELKRNPREIAKEIIDNLVYDNNVITKIEIAGPGFLNFYFSNNYVTEIIKEIFSEKDEFGKANTGAGKRAIVEFVSANPTGPLTVGHGRNAVIGDTISNLLEWIGYDVDREYYFNNAGRQMRVLGESVKLRYKELLGESIEFPDDHYQGEYIKDIAQILIDEYNDSLLSVEEVELFKDKAESEIFNDIKNTLKNIKIEMKNFFNEFTLYDEGKIDDVLQKLEEKNLSYKKDDATWFKLTELGAEQDKVIIKSTGEPTYRLPDIAYHITKFERKYDLIIDLFGSDHNATYPDVLAGCKALGMDLEKLKVLIHQFVTIMEDGEVVKMSTRKANFITLDELINEVGSDVVRYFFIMRSISSHLNFDLELAKKSSEENPVFYLQYAHARIASIIRTTDSEGLKENLDHLELLSTETEQALIKKLFEFRNVVLYSATNFEPHKLASYLEELAAAFHKFYNECRILGSEKNLAEARIALARATQIVIKNGLTILGLDAPEKM